MRLRMHAFSSSTAAVTALAIWTIVALTQGCSVELNKQVADVTVATDDVVGETDVSVEADVVAEDVTADDLVDSGATPLCQGEPACNRQGVCVALGDDVVPECVEGVWVCDTTDLPGYEAEEQTCDGLDNDCDGLTDEALTDVAESDCAAVGVCAVGGVRAVCLQGEWLCDYTGVAGFEATEASCDGQDNDCDGDTDEALIDPTDAAGVCAGEGVCADAGVAQCEGAAWVCDLSGVPGYEAEEATCDGLDNDCDGETDEDLTAPAGVAPVDDGVCALLLDVFPDAVPTCVEGEWVFDYTAVPRYETDETVCDGLDNDCDGETDEPGSVEAGADDCPTGGVCAEGVVATCVEGGWQCDFTGVTHYEEEEVSCDGLDNDCDGETDEDVTAPDALDTLGCPNRGVCAGEGAPSCQGGEWVCDYAGVVGYEAVEATCDGIDNDCDGATDENLFDAVEAGCKFRGLCSENVRAACLLGTWICDYSQVVGYEEEETSCDSFDNDCDGMTDEDLTDVSLSDCPQAGVCATGMQAECVSGGWTCDFNGVTGYEEAEATCDGLDNDCDGLTDLDPDGESLADPVVAGCDLVGVCAGGGVAAICGGDGWSCSYEGVTDYEAEEVTCDGLDNDCDGMTDEADGVANDPDRLSGCLTDGACDGTVTATCTTGEWVCDYTGVPAYEAGTETLCDDIDNDCDGATDEDLTNLTSTTDCLAQGVCAEGDGVPATCSSGVWDCDYASLAQYEAVEASCDMLDNDCDGGTDVGVCTGPGVPCDDAAGCDSLACRSDLDEDGMFCAEDDTHCVIALDAPSAVQVADGTGACLDESTFKTCGSGTWSALQDCPEVTPVCLDSDGQCHLCVPETRRCEAGDVVVCDASGDAYVPDAQASCGAAEFCAGDGLCFSDAEVAPMNVVAGDQTRPSVGFGVPQSAWFLTWESPNAPGGEGVDIRVRRVTSPGGAAAGLETTANQTIEGDQRAPDLSMFPNGGFVVVWEDLGGADGDGAGVFARPYLASGFALSSEIPINLETTGDQTNVRVATYLNGDGAGEFVAAYQGPQGVYFRRFPQASTGAPLDPADVQVNVSTFGLETRPDVAALDGGTIAVVWEAPSEVGLGQDIRMRIFGADGVGGAELSIVDDDTGEQTRPRIVAVPGTGFLVVWEEPDSAGAGVFARLFDSTGVAIDVALSIPSDEAGEQTRPAVSMTGTPGVAVVSWEDSAIDGDDLGIAARTLDLMGAAPALGAATVQVNETAAGAQTLPAVATGPFGVYLGVWVSSDGDGDGVVARILPVPAAD